MNLIDELEHEKSHADAMTAAANYWMARAQRAERRELELGAMLVDAAGGKIEIGYETLAHRDALELVREEVPAQFKWIFRVRRRTALRRPPTDASNENR